MPDGRRAALAPPCLCAPLDCLVAATHPPDPLVLSPLSLDLFPSSASFLLTVRGRRDCRRAPPQPQPSPCPSDVASSSVVDPYAVSTEPRDEKSLGAPPQRLLPSRVTEIADDCASAPTCPRARWPSPPPRSEPLTSPILFFSHPVRRSDCTALTSTRRRPRSSPVVLR